jgi:hypothetical protein
MTDISTSSTIRRQQFRATARDILDRAARGRGGGDRVGELAAAMERAYAAGARNAGLPEEAPDAAGFVRWDALPKRSQELLQDAAPLVRLHAQGVRDGSVLAIVENAGDSSARGERATLSIWRKEGNDIRRIDGRDRDFASSSASTLVRLGILAPLAMEDESQRWVAFTPLGLATIDRAVEDEHIFVY